MKILLIDVNCKGSSTGKIVYDLYTHINKSSDEAAVCYGRGEKIREKNIYKFGLDWETYIHAFLTRFTGYTGCFSFFSTRRLINYIKEFKPDVVHIHELHAYFVNIKPLLLYLKGNDIRTIMTLHCEFNYTGKCGHSVECEKWKIECDDCPHLHDYPSVMFFDHTKHMFQQKRSLLEDFANLTVVAPSKWLADRVKYSFLKNHEIIVINNGVDTDVFYPKNSLDLKKKHLIDEDEKIVVAIAPNLMSREKGGQYVLQLAEHLKSERIRFILIGVDGETEKAEGNTVLIGRIRDKDLLARYYSLADIFVICSERENYPTTCLEAQSCGTPVFGFSTGGTEETSLSNYERFVRYDDTEHLANLIRFTHRKTYEESNGLHKTAVMKFDNKHSLERYRDLYYRKK